MRGGFLGQATFEHQQAKRQGQGQRGANTGGLTYSRSRQRQVPEFDNANQREQRPAAKPQHRRANLLAKAPNQPRVPARLLNRYFNRGFLQRLGAPIGHPPRRL